MIYNFYNKPTNVAVWTRRCRIAIHTHTYTIDLLTQEVLTHTQKSQKKTLFFLFRRKQTYKW